MKNQLPFLCNSFLRKIMLLSCILFCLQPSQAQYELLSQDFNASDGLVAPRTIGSDAQGNIFVAGWYSTLLTLGSFTLDNSPSTAIAGFIGKFDPALGDWVWVKKIVNVSIGSQFATSFIEDLAVDAQGNVYFTGQFRAVIKIDNVQLTSTKQGQQYTNDILLVKLSPSGSVVYVKGYGTKSGADHANAIALDGSNNIYLGGQFGNESNCYYSGYQKNELYLLKLNNLGVVLWQKRYPATNPFCENRLTILSLALDASGSIFMTGNYQGTVSFGTGSGMTISSVDNSVDPFSAKISNNGTTQWVKAIASTSGHETGSALCVDASGNGYFGGPYSPVGYLNKYSSSGTLNWSADPFQLSVNRIISLGGNSLLAVGGKVGFKTIDTSNGSVTDSDSLIGNDIIPGTGTGSFGIRDVAPYGSGYVFMVTGQCGYVTLDNLQLICGSTCEETNSSDIFLIRTNSLPMYAAPVRETQLENADEFLQSNLEFNLYPNPVRDELRIEFSTVIASGRMTIHDQFGKEIWSRDAEEMISMELPLDENRFSPGVYYFTAISKGEVQTRRFIVSK